MNKVIDVSFYPREGKLESVTLKLAEPIERYANRRIDGLATSKIKSTEDNISFPVSTLVAQLVSLSDDIAALRNQDVLDRIDFKSALKGADIDFDIRFVKKGDVKKDSNGKIIPLRDENRVILMTIDEKTKLPVIVPARYEDDAAIKDIKVLKLTEEALTYLKNKTKKKQEINDSIDSLKANVKALKELFPEMSMLDMATAVLSQRK